MQLRNSQQQQQPHRRTHRQTQDWLAHAMIQQREENVPSNMGCVGDRRGVLSGVMG